MIFYKVVFYFCDDSPPLSRPEEAFACVYVIVRIFFINGFIFFMATFMDIWLLGRSLGYARDDNWRIALFLGLGSFLWNVGFLFVRLFSYFYNDSPIVISTGGSFCFRNGEIFLIDMGLLGFIFLLMVLFFLWLRLWISDSYVDLSATIEMTSVVLLCF